MSRRLCLGCLAVLTACNRSGADTGESTSLSSTRVPVGLGTVARDSIRDLGVVSGRLAPKPGGAALLTAPAAGVVTEVRAQVGTQVRRGDELLLLEVPELASDARQKEAAAAQAEREAERQAGLLRDGVTSKRAAEEA